MAQTPSRDPSQIASTVSTRLTAEQSAAVEAAARLVGASTSKFIRDASVMRAADILNAQEENGRELRLVAQQVVDHLLNPRITIAGVTEAGAPVKEDYGVEFIERLKQDGVDDIRFAIAVDNNVEWDDIKLTWASPVVVNSKSIEHLKAALKNAGSELCKLILENLESTNRNERAFAPRVSARALLQDDLDTSANS